MTHKELLELRHWKNKYKPKTVPKGHRLLRINTKIKEGDLFYVHCGKYWEPAHMINSRVKYAWFCRKIK